MTFFKCAFKITIPSVFGLSTCCGGSVPNPTKIASCVKRDLALTVTKIDQSWPTIHFERATTSTVTIERTCLAWLGKRAMSWLTFLHMCKASTITNLSWPWVYCLRRRKCIRQSNSCVDLLHFDPTLSERTNPYHFELPRYLFLSTSWRENASNGVCSTSIKGKGCL